MTIGLEEAIARIAHMERLFNEAGVLIDRGADPQSDAVLEESCAR